MVSNGVAKRSWGVTTATSTCSSSADVPLPIARSEPSRPAQMTTPPATCTITPYVPRSEVRDDVDCDVAIDVDPSITMFLDGSMRERGPDDYAIESLASSIMEDTVEATTETYYVGKHQEDEPRLNPESIPYLDPLDIASRTAKWVTKASSTKTLERDYIGFSSI